MIKREKLVISENGKRAEIYSMLENWYRIEMNGEIVEAMTFGITRARKKAYKMMREKV